MLVSRLPSGTSTTMQLVPVHLELPLVSNLHTRMCDVVPCDWIVQSTYCFDGSRLKGHKTLAEHVIFVIRIQSLSCMTNCGHLP